MRNRRYMNINVHSSNWNLGLCRVWGSMPAERCVEILKAKLENFGLNLSVDIVAIITDGASVMKKVGRLIPANHHLCMAHELQLALQVGTFL